jgi:enoyl-CoA hydratase/carnithine racemase
MSYAITCELSADGLVATVSFSDPVRQNQLCWGAVDELAQTLRCAREGGARVLIVASTLQGHWLEHAWLEDLQAGLQGREQTGTGMGWFEALEELTHEAVVSIAAISGDCSGGGAELGWACDLRIAEPQARFAQPEINLGLTTGVGGCSRLARLAGRAVTTDMVLTGQPQSARRLFELGAISRLVERGQALAKAQQLAAQLTQKSPDALAGLKRILDYSDEHPLADALAFEQQTFQQVVVTEPAMAAVAAAQQAYDSGGSVNELHNYGEVLPPQDP